MEEQQNLQKEYDKIYKIFTNAIKTAAEMTHCYNTFQAKNKRIDEVLSLDNKEILWQTLQEYLKEYGSFINKTTVISGIYIYPVDIEQYNAMTVVDIKMQLEMLKRIVIAKEIVHSVYQKTFKECLKKILQKTKLFPQKVLESVF